MAARDNDGVGGDQLQGDRDDANPQPEEIVHLEISESEVRRKPTSNFSRTELGQSPKFQGKGRNNMYYANSYGHLWS